MFGKIYLHSVTHVWEDAKFAAFAAACEGGGSPPEWTQKGPNPEAWEAPQDAAGRLVLFGRMGAPKRATPSPWDYAHRAAVEDAEDVGIPPEELVAVYTSCGRQVVFLAQKDGAPRARVYVARPESTPRLGAREENMRRRGFGVLPQIFIGDPNSFLFENHEIKFDVIVTKDVTMIREYWFSQTREISGAVVLAPDEFTEDDIRGKRVICDYKTLSLREAALCEYVLELPPRYPQVSYDELASAIMRTRQVQPYRAEVARWAEVQQEQQQEVPVDRDLKHARMSMVLALSCAARAVGPAIARRIVYRHPEVTEQDTKERRAYHADVFKTFKTLMSLDVDVDLPYEVADLIYEACEEAWHTQPFPPTWVRDKSGTYALRVWHGRSRGEPVVTYETATDKAFDRTAWEVVRYEEVPSNVTEKLNSYYEMHAATYRHFSALETGLESNEW